MWQTPIRQMERHRTIARAAVAQQKWQGRPHILSPVGASHLTNCIYHSLRVRLCFFGFFFAVCLRSIEINMTDDLTVEIDVAWSFVSWDIFTERGQLEGLVRIVFLSRVSTLTRVIDIAIPSVRCVLWKRLKILLQFFFTLHIFYMPNHSSFTSIKHIREIPTRSPPAGALNAGWA